MDDVHYYIRFDLNRYEVLKDELSKDQREHMEIVKTCWERIYDPKYDMARLAFVRDQEGGNPTETSLLSLQEKGIVEVLAYSSMGKLGCIEDDSDGQPIVVI